MMQASSLPFLIQYYGLVTHHPQNRHPIIDKSMSVPQSPLLLPVCKVAEQIMVILWIKLNMSFSGNDGEMRSICKAYSQPFTTHQALLSIHHHKAQLDQNLP